MSKRSKSIVEAKFNRVDDWLYKLNDMDRILLNRLEILERKLIEMERNYRNETD